MPEILWVPLITLGLGWTLGLLSHFLTRRITDRFEKKRFVSGSVNELKVVRSKLMNTIVGIDGPAKEMASDEERWVNEHAVYLEEGPLRDSYYEITNHLSQLEAKKREGFRKNVRSKMSKVRGSYRTISSPYIEYNTGSVPLLAEKSQMTLSRIKMMLNTYNEQTVKHGEYQAMTYGNRADEEKARIVANIGVSLSALRLMSVEIIDDIDLYIDMNQP